MFLRGHGAPCPFDSSDPDVKLSRSLSKPFALITLLIVLAGCGERVIVVTATPVPPTPIPLAIQTALAAEPTRAGLPPSWTPAPTRTPRPTFTPFPTATMAPLPSIAQVCQNFDVVLAPPNDALLNFHGTATFVWRNVPRSAGGVAILITQNDRLVFRAIIPFSGQGIFPVPLRRLPGDGRFEWTLWVQYFVTALPVQGGYLPLYIPVCLHHGSFTVKPPEYF